MSSAADEAPIDSSLTHYLEERALAIALDKPAAPGQRENLADLMRLEPARRAGAGTRCVTGCS